MTDLLFNWKRFWCPRGAEILLTGGGFLLDPESEFGSYNPHVVPFEEIRNKPCLVLLGEPGIGKTTALEHDRAETEAAVRRADEILHWQNLNVYQSDVLLVRSLFEEPAFVNWRTGSGILHLFLDSLDECLIRIDTLAALLAQELARCPIDRLRLRIACRTAMWPGLLETQLKRLWGEDAIGVYELVLLRRRDAAAAAASYGISPEAFLSEVDRHEAGALASRPITLRFLLTAYQKCGGFPPSQVELYKQGCGRLSEEINVNRRAARLVGTLAPRQRFHIASRIAALSIFCGRQTIWIGAAADTLEGGLHLHDVLSGAEPIEGQDLTITEMMVREVLDTGLFSARGPECLGFAHQTYAEFLAAWYLQHRHMDASQMLSLITHAGDEGGRVVPQLQETAAWLASFVPAVYDRIVQSDPQVLLSSDITTMSPAARERLVGWLLQLFDAGILIDSQWGLRAKYQKLSHPRLPAQVEPFIRAREKNTIVRRVAIDIAEGCNLQSLQGLLADIVLDPTENQHIREQAAAAVFRIADRETKRRLKPCVAGIENDMQDELKGWALQALWPDDLTSEEVFAALTPPKRRNLIGAYKSFVSTSLVEHLLLSGLPTALRWVAEQPARDDPEYSFRDLVDALLCAAWEHLDTPGVLDPYAASVAKRLASHLSVPGPKPTAESEGDRFKRHRLVEAVVPIFIQHDTDPMTLVFTQTPLVFPRDFPWLIECLRSAI